MCKDRMIFGTNVHGIMRISTRECAFVCLYGVVCLIVVCAACVVCGQYGSGVIADMCVQMLSTNEHDFKQTRNRYAYGPGIPVLYQDIVWPQSFDSLGVPDPPYAQHSLELSWGSIPLGVDAGGAIVVFVMTTAGVFGVRVCRRAYRHKKQRCIECGYQCNDQLVCSECGARRTADDRRG